MVTLLKLIFFGHIHKWEKVGNSSTWEKHLDGQLVAKGPRFICRCEKCGVFKAFDL